MKKSFKKPIYEEPCENGQDKKVHLIKKIEKTLENLADVLIYRSPKNSQPQNSFWNDIPSPLEKSSIYFTRRAILVFSAAVGKLRRNSSTEEMKQNYCIFHRDF